MSKYASFEIVILFLYFYMHLYLLAIVRRVILYLPQYCNYITCYSRKDGKAITSIRKLSLSFFDDVNVDKYNMVMTCGAMQGSFLCTIPHDMYWPGNIKTHFTFIEQS